MDGISDQINLKVENKICLKSLLYNIDQLASLYSKSNEGE